MHVPADLRLGAAQGDVLDVTVMRIIEGDSNAARQGKTRSLLTKFFTCAHETGALPLIPTRAATYFRFMCWLSANGIDSGWVGALKYVTAVVHLNRSLGFEDFRKHPATLFYWERFRRNFKQMVQSAHKAMKWPIRPGHLEAMALSTDLSIADNLAAICSYFLLFFCGCRIGHVAQSRHRRSAVGGHPLRAVAHGADHRVRVLPQHQDAATRSRLSILDGNRAATSAAILPSGPAESAHAHCVPRSPRRLRLLGRYRRSPLAGYIHGQPATPPRSRGTDVACAGRPPPFLRRVVPQRLPVDARCTRPAEPPSGRPRRSLLGRELSDLHARHARRSCGQQHHDCLAVPLFLFFFFILTWSYGDGTPSDSRHLCSWGLRRASQTPQL